MSCTICGEHINKRIYCGPCAGYLILHPRINLIKVQEQVAALQAQLGSSLEPSAAPPAASDGGAANVVRAAALDSQVAALRAQLRRTQQATLAAQSAAERLRQQADAARSETAAATQATRARVEAANTDYSGAAARTQEAITSLERDYRTALHSSLAAQTRCVRDLLEIFALKKKRRRTDYDVVLGFDTIPPLGQLAHYPPATINSGVERVAYFATLLASYLGMQLPFQLTLPRKAEPHPRAGGLGDEGIELYIAHSVKTMMRSAPAEFFAYCRGLAMLALDVAYLAGRLGVPNIDVAAVPRINQLVAQISLRLESLVKSGHQIQVQAMALTADVDTIQDQIITSIDVDINGGSAEWNIVEATEAA